MIDASDIIKIHQLLARYGQAIDRRDWDKFTALFTPDASIDYQGGSGRAKYQGRENIVQWFRDLEDTHPPAHHVTNIIVEDDAPLDGPVEVVSKFLAPFTRPEHNPKRVYGGDYLDIVVRTSVGWQFKHKECKPVWNLAIKTDDEAAPHRLTF